MFIRHLISPPTYVCTCFYAFVAVKTKSRKHKPVSNSTMKWSKNAASHDGRLALT